MRFCEGMRGLFDEMYAREGRPSIPPERLLRARVLIALYSVRSENLFCEQLKARLPDQPEDSQTGGGRIWLDEDSGRISQDPLQRHRPNSTYAHFVGAACNLVRMAHLALAPSFKNAAA